MWGRLIDVSGLTGRWILALYISLGIVNFLLVETGVDHGVLSVYVKFPAGGVDVVVNSNLLDVYSLMVVVVAVFVASDVA